MFYWPFQALVGRNGKWLHNPADLARERMKHYSFMVKNDISLDGSMI